MSFREGELAKPMTGNLTAESGGQGSLEPSSILTWERAGASNGDAHDKAYGIKAHLKCLSFE